MRSIVDYSSAYDSKILPQPLVNGTGGNTSLYENKVGGVRRKRKTKRKKNRRNKTRKYKR